MKPIRFTALGLAILAIVALLLSTASAGDPEIAKMVYRKAEKEFRAKRYKESADLYRRALAEHSPYPEAAYGLGLSLEKLGNGNSALQAYLECRRQVETIPKLTSKQRSCGKRARKAIARLGKIYNDVDDRQGRFIKDCISYGEKHRKSSPAWAKRAFEAVLALDPKNEKAVAAVKELIDVQRAGGGFGLPEFLIKRDSMSGWDGAEYSSRWTCKGRTITGDQRSPGIICYRSGVFLRKTYRLTVRARVVERYSADWYWGLMFGTDANAPKMYSFGYGYQQDVYLVRNAGTNMKDLWSKPKTHWDPKEWHILRVDVTPDKVTCYADGEEVFSHGAELARDFEGTMGLNIRGARVEFTDLKVYR